MTEYKFVSKDNVLETEQEVNKLAKKGWKLLSFLNEGFGSWTVAVMVKE